MDIADAITAVYSSRGELNKTFVTRTRAVLKGIAGLSAELKTFSDNCFGEVSRIAAHVNLAYHQVSHVSVVVVLSQTHNWAVHSRDIETCTVLRPQAAPRGLCIVTVPSAVFDDEGVNTGVYRFGYPNRLDPCSIKATRSSW